VSETETRHSRAAPGTREERTPKGPVEEIEQTVARGRSWSTPFVLLAGVALTVWGVAALVTLAALLVWWIA
jgi:hypothetical protein